MDYFVDTHVLLWHFFDPTRLSRAAKEIFRKKENHFLVPMISVLEIQYLCEIGRIEVDIDELLGTLQHDSAYELVPFDEFAMLQAIKLTGTRDPFDRIILGHALARHLKILTKDRWMRDMAPQTALF